MERKLDEMGFVESKLLLTSEDLKDLSRSVLNEKGTIGIGAAVVTSMIDRAYLEPNYLANRGKIITDIPSALVSAIINKNYLRTAFYLVSRKVPVILEQKGHPISELYDVLKQYALDSK